jgi:hypothetical protein
MHKTVKEFSVKYSLFTFFFYIDEKLKTTTFASAKDVNNYILLFFLIYY